MNTPITISPQSTPSSDTVTERSDRALSTEKKVKVTRLDFYGDTGFAMADRAKAVAFRDAWDQAVFFRGSKALRAALRRDMRRWALTAVIEARREAEKMAKRRAQYAA